MSGKANALLSLINLQENDDIIVKIYLNPKDPYEAKHQYLIKNVKNLVLNILKIQRLSQILERYARCLR